MPDAATTVDVLARASPRGRPVGARVEVRLVDAIALAASGKARPFVPLGG